MLYRALAYFLVHLWTLLSPLRSTLIYVIDATTYHPTTGRNIIVDIVMTICTLLVWLTLVGCMLLHKESIAKPPHVSLNQANESMVNALKAVQRARDDCRDMEDTSAATTEALWGLRQAGKDMREILVEMSDIFDQKEERQLSRTFPINSSGSR
ncbi:hypothetical protein BDR04DRAFT_1110506 [Suillus decipiens]|nr:hypothetical protein BDR04DRAFT_1110506 [Suillus decipiens]